MGHYSKDLHSMKQYNTELEHVTISLLEHAACSLLSAWTAVTAVDSSSDFNLCRRDKVETSH